MVFRTFNNLDGCMQGFWYTGKIRKGLENWTISSLRYSSQRCYQRFYQACEHLPTSVPIEIPSLRWSRFNCYRYATDVGFWPDFKETLSQKCPHLLRKPLENEDHGQTRFQGNRQRKNFLPPSSGSNPPVSHYYRHDTFCYRECSKRIGSEKFGNNKVIEKFSPLKTSSTNQLLSCVDWFSLYPLFSFS